MIIYVIKLEIIGQIWFNCVHFLDDRILLHYGSHCQDDHQLCPLAISAAVPSAVRMSRATERSIGDVRLIPRRLSNLQRYRNELIFCFDFDFEHDAA